VGEKSIISAINNNDTSVILNDVFIEIFIKAYEVSEKPMEHLTLQSAQ